MARSKNLMHRATAEVSVERQRLFVPWPTMLQLTALTNGRANTGGHVGGVTAAAVVCANCQLDLMG